MGCSVCKTNSTQIIPPNNHVTSAATTTTTTTTSTTTANIHCKAPTDASTSDGPLQPQNSDAANASVQSQFDPTHTNVSAAIGKWGRVGVNAGHIGAGATRIAMRTRPSIMTSRVKREKTIFETYRLTDSVLGTGISGSVRVATNKFNGQPFAIKTLNLNNISAKRTAMLHNEVAIYLQLDHPNIAKLMEVYEEETAIHLVMELCTGRELYDRLAAKKKYSEAVAARVASQMLSAIGYCHSHRICHRDLKLENWVYADPSEDAPLKLIDFGFSRIYNPGIPMTAMHGTVYYVSPEVMDGCYEEKCDIWSIGVIVFMLLSGSPPFNGSSDHEILIKIKRGSYSFAGSRWEGVSPEAKDFIASLLVKDPCKRPSAAEAQKHKWLCDMNATRTHELDVEILKQMRDFSLCNSMKRAAIGMISLLMSPQQLLDLEEQFKLLDKHNTGSIHIQELTSALNEKLELDSTECQRIFATLDQSGDHEVHYSEFMASTAHVKLLKDEHLIREAFRRFDVGNNGYITVDNLRQVLGDVYTGTKVEDIVKFCDHKGNNVIDYDEFLAALIHDDLIHGANSPPCLNIPQHPRNKHSDFTCSSGVQSKRASAEENVGDNNDESNFANR